MGKTIVYNPLNYPLYVMVKPVGALCNLDCSYCYYLEKDSLYRDRKINRMTDELLEKFTEEYINSQTLPEVSFTWHGGETLLRGIDFYRKAVIFQKQYGGGRTIVNSIQTNGLLLNDEWCRFFKDNNFLVGISIDGPEHIHDRYRLDKGGRGTFSRVMRGIELLQKHGVEFNTLSVINDYNVHYPVETYRFFKEIGSRYMQFSPIVERWGDRDDGLELLPPGEFYHTEMPPWCVKSEDFGQFYCDMFDEWIKEDVGSYFVQMFDATLAGMVGQPPGVCVFGKTCGHAAALEHNGDLYACDHFVYPEYRLGNIRTESIISMMLSAKQTSFGNDKWDKLPRQCRECTFLRLCNGECPKNRILKSSTGEPGLNYLCKGLKKYFAHVLTYMEFMACELDNERPPSNVMEYARAQKKTNK
ncbi:anaerobic sulfatase-maturation protein [Coprobacter tertius]|uniref:Anaerobic sulfatase-maturation protein n=1 Tax=Coprobacter tertius TaxID=2944915 RepID=A0ABT1MKE9_9BACT|nr:anaerobic sulfatase-maturation protein [Coprobacter tertius]MCP9612326.1 anaerobic sulfatase-maturation protein [Coprobacter tertius]